MCQENRTAFLTAQFGYGIKMSRRYFMRTIMALFKSMPNVSFAVDSEPAGSEGLPYKPLNGRSLRLIAHQKRHHSSNGYLNPLGLERRGRLWKVMSWKLFHENRFKKYYDDEKVIPVSIDWEPLLQHQGVAITFLKHAGVMIKDRDRYILVDPVFHNLFWFIKDFTPLEMDLKTMPAPHHVLITHGHYDHLDKPSLALLSKKTHVITPLGYNDIFSELDMRNRTQLDWFNSHRDGKLQITLLPCNHWTMRNPFTGPNHSLWGSYLIRTAGGFTIYVSGDTAYFDGFEQLGKEFDIDLAVFNLGAYEPRWFMASSHLNPRECVQAFKELKAGQLMVVHWGTFRLGDEPVYFPPLQIKQELQKEGLVDRLVDLKHGQTLFL
jgi:N-acyl-phosphatidylethanolamine-hydrolysing phospholipase D